MMNDLWEHCPYAYPERDENYTLHMCSRNQDKIWGVTESDCETCIYHPSIPADKEEQI